jgi:hypothetical protein
MGSLNDFKLDMDPGRDRYFYRYVARIVATELSSISSPCYYPKLIKYWKELYNITNFDFNELERFKKTISPEYRSFDIFMDKQNIFLYICLIHFSKKNMKEYMNLLYQFITVKMYSHLVHRSFPKFCRNDLWEMTMNQISPRHLFKVCNGIPNALIYLSNAEFKRYYPKLITDIDDDTMYKLLYAIRTRISQSVKSFATLYYDMFEGNKGGIGVIGDEEESGGGSSVADKVAEKISTSMCTYGTIDKKSLMVALNFSGLRKELGISILDEISSVDYKTNISFITILISRVKNINDVCIETKRMSLIRKIETKVKVGQYEVRKVILDFLYGLEIGYQLKKYNSSQVVLFFLHYMTLYIRARICS